MVHLISVIFFLALLVALAALLERIVRDNQAAIRNALFGTGIAVVADDGALGRIGACLRASFPGVHDAAPDAALRCLLVQISDQHPSRRDPRRHMA